MIGRAAGVITVSESIADELMRRYPISRPTVVLNAPELDNAETTTPGLREYLQLGEEQSLAIYVGKLARHRGLTACVRALADMADLHFACIGPSDPEFAASLQQQAAELGVAER